MPHRLRQRLALAACAMAAVLVVCGAARAQNLSELFRKASPSVAIVYTVEKVPALGKGAQLTKLGSLGSGVLITADGLLATAAHVVHNAENIVVEFKEGAKVAARIKSSLPSADVALLQLENVPEGAVPAQLADSDKVSVGDPIFIIGAPYGIGHTLTAGYISARHQPNKVIRDFEMAEFFQTDAAINTGNSGGPMFNLNGEVIGIVSNILSRSGGFEGVGFAVTSNTARKVLIDEPTPWSGIEVYLLNGDMARAFNLPQQCGALVERVAVGSPGFRAGLRGGTIQATFEGEAVMLGGDVILDVAGVAVSGDHAEREKLWKAVSAVPRGVMIRIRILRAGELLEIEAPRE